MIIDSHLHLPPAGDSMDLGKSHARLANELTDCGVEYAIVIPDNVHGSAIGDLETCLNLLANAPNLFLLGTIDVRTEAEERIAWLDQLLQSRRICGMKIFPGWDPIYPTDDRLIPVYELCQKHDAPVVIHTGENSGDPRPAAYNDPQYIVEVARSFPRLSIVISHFYWPKIRYCYEVTEGVTNIFFDTSALADSEVVAASGLATIQEFLLRTIRQRPGRVLFGSDYACCPIMSHIDLIRSLPLSPQEREDVFWRNSSRLFHLKCLQCRG